MRVDGDLVWWSPARRGVIPVRGFTRVPLAAAGGARLRDPRRHRVRRGDPRLRRPGGRTAGSTTTFIAAYTRLHELGWAHSVEAWDEDGLAGGLYGVAIGGLFAAESKFHRRTGASKAALLGLVELLAARQAARGCSTSSGRRRISLARCGRDHAGGVPRAARRRPPAPGRVADRRQRRYEPRQPVAV